MFNNVRAMVASVLLVASLLMSSLSVAATHQSAVLLDANSGELLYALSPREMRPPASITKIMTLFLTFDALSSGRLKLDDRITISRNAADQAPSRLGLAPGKSIRVEDAIRIIALKSANDLSMAMAERLGGSEAGFAEMMNRKAKALGMNNTHFVNPTGLPNPAHLTSAYDIAILSMAMLRTHPDRYSFFSQKYFRYGDEEFTNHNKLLGVVEGVDGIKTGFTNAAGYTLAASAKRNGRRLIAVVLGEPSINERNRDVTQLLEAGFTVLSARDTGRKLRVVDQLSDKMDAVFLSATGGDDKADAPVKPRVLLADLDDALPQKSPAAPAKMPEHHAKAHHHDKLAAKIKGKAKGKTRVAEASDKPDKKGASKKSARAKDAAKEKSAKNSGKAPSKDKAKSKAKAKANA